MAKRTPRTNRPRGVNLYGAGDVASVRQVAQDVGPVVYAVRQDDGIIKIGYTTNIYQRLGNVGGHHALLALVPGTYEDEQKIHAALEPHRARRREYYHPTAEVIDVVNGMRATLRQDPITA